MVVLRSKEHEYETLYPASQTYQLWVITYDDKSELTVGNDEMDVLAAFRAGKPTAVVQKIARIPLDEWGYFLLKKRDNYGDG